MDWLWLHLATRIKIGGEQQYARGPISQEWLNSPFNALIQRSLAGEKILGCGAGWNSAQSNETFPRS